MYLLCRNSTSNVCVFRVVISTMMLSMLGAAGKYRAASQWSREWTFLSAPALQKSVDGLRTVSEFYSGCNPSVR